MLASMLEAYPRTMSFLEANSVNIPSELEPSLQKVLSQLIHLVEDTYSSQSGWDSPQREAIDITLLENLYKVLASNPSVRRVKPIDRYMILPQ